MQVVENPATNVLLHGEETGGQVSVTDIVVPPHDAGPPLHARLRRGFYMLEGELIFQVDDALVTEGAGEVSFAPRNVAHAWRTTVTRPRATCAHLRARGLRRHWARIAAEATGVGSRSGRCSQSPRSRSSARRSRRRPEAALGCC